MNFSIYRNQEEIKVRAIEIMKESGNEQSNKEYSKKTIELFHLLVYFDVVNLFNEIDKIIPHEPGDFLVKYKSGETLLIEIVTVFGDIEAKNIRDNLSKLFNFRISDVESLNQERMYDDSKMNKLFARILESKSKKQYFLQQDSKLLLVTAEHDRCGTIPWYLSSKNRKCVENFISNTKTPIKVINYFRSGKDNGPVVNDCFNEMEEALNVFKN